MSNIIIKTVKSKTITKKDVLLLQEPKKELNPNAETILERHQRFGLNNTSTAKKILSKKREVEDENHENFKKAGKNEMLKWFVNNMMPFKIISYKEFYKICEQYGLFISRINNYSKMVPEHALDSMESFFGKVEKHEDSFKKLKIFSRNDGFTFNKVFGERLTDISTDSIFKIAAPLHHFDKKTYNTKIGQELGYVEKPKLSGNIDLRDIPRPTDPLIFLPFKNLNELYCVYIDGWDKESDDFRLREIL